MTELTEISGIGPSKADDLRDAGFESAEDIAAASPSDIQAVDGFSDSRAADVHENALDLISVEEDEDTDETEETEEESTEDAEEVEDEVYTFDPDFDEQQRNHLIRALSEKEVEEIQKRDYDRAERTRDVVEQTIEGGEMELSEDQIHILYSAITHRMNDYHGTRGITDLSRSIREAQEQVRDFREENLF